MEADVRQHFRPQCPALAEAGGDARHRTHFIELS